MATLTNTVLVLTALKLFTQVLNGMPLIATIYASLIAVNGTIEIVAAILLVQGLAESGPLLGWGWFFVIMLAFKIKQAPLLGRGPSEQRLVGEQGEIARMAR